MWPKKHVETSLSSNAIAQNPGERLEMNITHNRIALPLNANEINKDQPRMTQVYRQTVFAEIP